MRYAIGIDLGGTNLRAAIVSSNGEVVSLEAEPAPSPSTPASDVVVRIVDMCERLRKERSDSHIIAVGVGVSACVSCDDGVVCWSYKIPLLNGYPLADSLGHAMGLPVFIDNSSNNAGRGEHVFGAANGMTDFVLVTLGTGVGGAIFADGRLLDGKSGFAGEVGHMTLAPDGKVCGCGHNGCWEAYGSASALARSAEQLLDRGVTTSLARGLKAEDVIGAAQAGDSAALSLVDEWCRWNALGIANLVNLFNCEACVVGGGPSTSELVMRQIQTHAQRYIMPPIWPGCRIVPAELGGSAGYMGSAALCFTKLPE